MPSPRPVLVVDDDNDLRENLCEILVAEGYETVEARNGQEALDFLDACPPDKLPECIILDLMMPIMDGRTFLQKLCERHPEMLSHVKVFVWTARGSSTKPVADLPIDVEVLQKPADLTDLLRTVEKHCRPPKPKGETIEEAR